MRAVAIVDVGSDSTETLVFVPTAEGPREVARRRKITSLGTRVHETGRLERAAIERVLAALDAHDELAHEHGCTATRALLTSAVRDASDGHELEALLGARGYEVTVLTEADEARLTFLGNTAGRATHDPVVVVDVGGGSTEIALGTPERIDFATSIRVGAVRQLERHVRHDPPTSDELSSLRAEIRRRFEAGVPQQHRREPRKGIATAGTDSWLPAAGDFVLTRDYLTDALDRLARMTVKERVELPGIDPDRAGTIFVGAAILLEAMNVFGLDGFEMSNRGVLDGAALAQPVPT